MYRNHKPLVIDLAVILIFFVTIVVFSLADLAVKPELIPSIMNGLTTATSILVGISGLFISQNLSNAQNMDKLRTIAYTLILAMVLVFIGIAYTTLAIADDTTIAFKMSLSIFQISYSLLIALIFHRMYSK